MGEKVFPHGVASGYLLDVVINNSSPDEEFYLCHDAQGEISVRIFYSPNNSWSRGRWSEPILPAEFDQYEIEGISLRSLVEKRRHSISNGSSDAKP